MNDRFNYQVMSEQASSEYLPDYDMLIQNATCNAEADKWRELQACKRSFAWNMVYCAQMKCGHFEVFQTPQNEHCPLDDNLKRAREYAEHSKCSLCIINYRHGEERKKNRDDAR